MSPLHRRISFNKNHTGKETRKACKTGVWDAPTNEKYKSQVSTEFFIQNEHIDTDRLKTQQISKLHTLLDTKSKKDFTKKFNELQAEKELKKLSVIRFVSDCTSPVKTLHTDTRKIDRSKHITSEILGSLQHTVAAVHALTLKATGDFFRILKWRTECVTVKSKKKNLIRHHSIRFGYAQLSL